MNFIYSILIGFLIGALARFVKPGDDKMGFLLTTLVGICGAVIASWTGQALNIYQASEPVSLIASVLGSVVLLFLMSIYNNKKA